MLYCFVSEPFALTYQKIYVMDLFHLFTFAHIRMSCASVAKSKTERSGNYKKVDVHVYVYVNTTSFFVRFIGEPLAPMFCCASNDAGGCVAVLAVQF